MDDEWMVLDGSASMTLHVYGHSSEAQACMPVIVTESSMGTVRGSQFELWMVIKNNAKMGITQRLKTSKVEIFRWNPMWSLTKARPHVKKKSEQSL